MAESDKIDTLNEQRCFDGVQGFYSHKSAACGGTMRFAVYQPPQALAGAKVPVVSGSRVR